MIHERAVSWIEEKTKEQQRREREREREI